MSRTQIASLLLFTAGIAAGTAGDRVHPRARPAAGGYQVLSADFHIHSSMFSDGVLTPWGLVMEAERQGLDVIAITGHNEVIDGKAARRFRSLWGGPTVLTGEEIVAADHHIVALGIERAIDFRPSAARTIEAIHHQGGFAIAAHPDSNFRFDSAAVASLDGAEICHPMIFGSDGVQRQAELERFLERAPLVPIGSSDFHGFGRMGSCRTFIFAEDDSPRAVMEALRAHRTVVYGLGGKVYGDSRFIALAESLPLRESLPSNSRGTWFDWVSRIAGLTGLGGILFPRRNHAQNGANAA